MVIPFLLIIRPFIRPFQDINECATSRPCHQICNNTEGSFRCNCEEGFRLDSDGATCIGKTFLFRFLAPFFELFLFQPIRLARRPIASRFARLLKEIKVVRAIVDLS